jgi:hypothetical protein
MAALDALPPRTDDIPDHPRNACWDCRVMIAEGLDPAALTDADAAAGAHLAPEDA